MVDTIFGFDPLPAQTEPFLPDLPPGYVDIPNSELDGDPAGCGERASPLDCYATPDLCRAQVFHVAGPFEAPLRLAIVGEGFTADDEDVFLDHIEWLTSRAVADDAGLIGQLGPHLRIDAAFVPSSSQALLNEDVADTPFGGCLTGGDLGDGRWSSDRPRARAFADQVLGDVDVIVLLLNAGVGRANAQYPWSRADVREGGAGEVPEVTIEKVAPVVNLNRLDDEGVLDHELGHALLHLGDEYVEREGCYGGSLNSFGTTETDPLSLTANLTVDGTGAKWAHVHDGAVEGGAQVASCIYHPTDHCRMLHSGDDRFCPVCQAEIAALVGALESDLQDGDPSCALEVRSMTSSPGLLYRYDVDVVGRDRNLPLRFSVFRGDQLIATGRADDARFAVMQDVPIEIDPPVASDEVRAFCTDGLGRRVETRLTVWPLSGP